MVQQTLAYSPKQSLNLDINKTLIKSNKQLKNRLYSKKQLLYLSHQAIFLCKNFQTKVFEVFYVFIPTEKIIFPANCLPDKHPVKWI